MIQNKRIIAAIVWGLASTEAGMRVRKSEAVAMVIVRGMVPCGSWKKEAK